MNRLPLSSQAPPDSVDSSSLVLASLGTYLSDSLLMLPAEQYRPRDPTRVLALQEERLGLAVLEAEDLAVAADVEFTLSHRISSAFSPFAAPSPVSAAAPMT